MNEPWKVAAAGTLGGVLLSVTLIFCAAQLGWLPARVSDSAIHDYLVSHPQVLVEVDGILRANDAADALKQQQSSIDKIGVKAFLDPKIAFLTGPANAKNTVVEFFDYNCPYCRASLPVFQKFYLAHQNDTRFAFIEFPIKGVESERAARVSLAARNQADKYMALHFALMSEKSVVDEGTVYQTAQKIGLDLGKILTDVKSSAIDDTMDSLIAIAGKAGLNSTPTYIINGKVVLGALKPGELESLMKN